MSSTKIHPTAIIDPSVELGEGVEVGPYSVIEGGVKIGDRTKVDPMVHIQGLTEIGPENHFYSGSKIGFPAQMAGVTPVPMRTVIGARNVFREGVTVHASMKPEGATVVGDGGFFMVNSHIAHDCQIGNQVIMANGVLLAGHVSVGDRAFLSGNAVVHQFCRIGRLVMVGGLARITNDVPPFMIVEGIPAKIRGINVVGLRRNDFSSKARLELKRLLREIFLTDQTVTNAVNALNPDDYSEAGREVLEFFKTTKRGVTAFSLLTRARGGAGEGEEE